LQALIKLKYYLEFPEGFKIWERENYKFLFQEYKKYRGSILMRKNNLDSFIAFTFLGDFVAMKLLWIVVKLMINGSLKSIYCWEYCKSLFAVGSFIIY
jgi:hypothetical protein